LVAGAEKKGDKTDKAATPEKGKKGTIRPQSEISAEEAKSPRQNGNEGGGAAAAEEVMVFSLGDVKLGLTHRKLLSDALFYDMEFVLGGVQGKKTAPTRAHRAVIQIRCPGLLQEGKFIAKIDKKKDRW
jgi:hypothetical protein